MKSIIRKTDQEIRQEATYTPIKVEDYPTCNDYWECLDHKVVFEPGDIVLLRKQGNETRLVCPLKTSDTKTLTSFLFFKRRTSTITVCGNGLMGADKQWYEARYKILQYNP